MKRRDFVKMLAGGLAAVGLPVAAKQVIPTAGKTSRVDTTNRTITLPDIGEGQGFSYQAPGEIRGNVVHYEIRERAVRENGRTMVIVHGKSSMASSFREFHWSYVAQGKGAKDLILFEGDKIHLAWVYTDSPLIVIANRIIETDYDDIRGDVSVVPTSSTVIAGDSSSGGSFSFWIKKS